MTRERFNISDFLDAARAEAREWNSVRVETTMLFITLSQMGGVTAEGLQEQGVDPKTMWAGMRAKMDPGKVQPSGELQLTRRARATLKKADALSKAENGAIAERHLLAAILDDDPRKSVTLIILAEFGVDLAALRQKTGVSAGTPTLDQLGRDLSRLARDGELNPMIGRKDELRRLARTLSRKSKNNPVLIGVAGVGKTAIVEGLAQKAATGRVPSLADKRIVEISAAGLVANTTFRGQFEERILNLVKEIKQAGNIVLFIDELHTILGAGKVKGGALDAGNILKPALARGELHLIGATTTEEYKRYIASDAALERRFQTILVEEPSQADTKKMLMGVKEGYEDHHMVVITEEAVDACVELAVKFLPERRLPDKAFDLMDEACARARMPYTISVPGQGRTGTEVTWRLVALVLADWLNMPVELLPRSDSGGFDTLA